MLDSTLIVASLAAAAVTAAAVLLLGGWPWRRPHPARTSLGGVLGVALGFLAGCWWLGTTTLQWPPREDQDRLLLVLLPAVIGVELAAAPLGRLGRLVWLPRLIVAAVAARVLLHGTVYLMDPPDTETWTSTRAWLILGGLAAALAGAWAALALRARRSPGRSVPLSLALACAAA